MPDQSFKQRFMDTFDGSPLDGTRTARVIAGTPEANQEARLADWRADLKRRVRNRLAAPVSAVEPVKDGDTT